MKCRFCRNSLKVKFADLGYSPLANNLISKKHYLHKEKYYQLRTWFCHKCLLVQTDGFSKVNEIFNSDYTYYSSISKTFLTHAKNYTDKIISSLRLKKKDFVIEIGSNDGYLLKNFVKKNIDCLGIEPSKNTAKVSEKFNIKVIKKFFTYNLALKLSKRKKADLVIANNVFAHVPNINDFTKALKKILSSKGCINIEFPHILNLINNNQYDTIYHEHFFYYSLHSIINIFKKYKLKIWKVEKIPTHGGSLRIYACHLSHSTKIQKSVKDILDKEKKNGLKNRDTYEKFQNKIELNKFNTLKSINEYFKKGKNVYGFGAAAKSITIINFLGIKKEFIKAIFDNSPAKIGKYLPGSRIPIIKPKSNIIKKCDLILIFAWNLEKEIVREIKPFLKKNGKIALIIPKFKVKTIGY
jgi:SAM-dependent methyltransferase